MILDDVHRGIQKRKPRKRIGRGIGSGHGKTAGKGHKGYYSHSGGQRRLSFEGGQIPLARRIAKRGFSNNRFAKNVAIVNVSALEQAFESGNTVDLAALRAKRLVSGNFDVVKILGNGTLKKKLKVSAHSFSKSAEQKITEAGGTFEVVVES
ncbi:MAG: 50S ribosomal protein L15 [Planctomycetaceae bacterium]